jgi:endoglucanase
MDFTQGESVSIKIVSILSFIIILFLGCKKTAQPTGPITPSAFSSLSIKDSKVVNEAGEPVVLKGINLGNWFIIELWMLSQSSTGINDQYSLENRLSVRFGKEEKERLMELYRENWITKKDFSTIKSFNMNLVRIPFWYTLIEDDENPMTIKENGWKWMDQAIDWAEEHGFYSIIDMHGAPGSQNWWDHSGRSDYNQLWSNSEYQERTVWLWSQIANRYKDIKSIFGYDVLNEAWGGSDSQLKNILFRCYQKIRDTGDRHIIILSSHFNNISFFTKDEIRARSNVMFTHHYYPGFFGNGEATIETHQDFIRNSLPSNVEEIKSYNTTSLIGEFNVVLKSAGGGKMMRVYYDTYSSYDLPTTMWSYKVLGDQGGIGNGVWGMVTNMQPIAKLDFNRDSKERIEAWFGSLSTMPTMVDEDLRHWLTTDDSPTVDDF